MPHGKKISGRGQRLWGLTDLASRLLNPACFIRDNGLGLIPVVSCIIVYFCQAGCLGGGSPVSHQSKEPANVHALRELRKEQHQYASISTESNLVYCTDPRALLTSSGNVVVVWLQRELSPIDSKTSELWSAALSGGAHADPAVRLTSPDSLVSDPSLIEMKSGSVGVIFQRKSRAWLQAIGSPEGAQLLIEPLNPGSILDCPVVARGVNDSYVGISVLGARHGFILLRAPTSSQEETSPSPPFEQQLDSTSHLRSMCLTQSGNLLCAVAARRETKSSDSDQVLLDVLVYHYSPKAFRSCATPVRIDSTIIDPSIRNKNSDFADRHTWTSGGPFIAPFDDGAVLIWIAPEEQARPCLCIQFVDTIGTPRGIIQRIKGDVDCNFLLPALATASGELYCFIREGSRAGDLRERVFASRVQDGIHVRQLDLGLCKDGGLWPGFRRGVDRRENRIILATPFTGVDRNGIEIRAFDCD